LGVRLTLDTRGGASSTDYQTPVTVDVLDNDLAPVGSVLTSVTGNNGIWELDADDVTYTPEAGFSGTALAFYYVTFPDGTSSSAMIVVMVAPPPSATAASLIPDMVSTAYQTPITIGVLDNDLALPAGSVVTAVTGNNGTWALDNNTVTYTPDAGFSGTAMAFYYVTYPDGTSGSSMIIVTVAPSSDGGQGNSGNGNGGNSGNSGNNGNSGNSGSGGQGSGGQNAGGQGAHGKNAGGKAAASNTTTHGLATSGANIVQAAASALLALLIGAGLTVASRMSGRVPQTR